jgi:hypothetical protein
VPSDDVQPRTLDARWTRPLLEAMPRARKRRLESLLHREAA